MMEGKKVGVFFGGKSAEHEISIITGEFALAELKKNGVDAVGIYVGENGNFYLEKDISELKFFQGNFSQKLQKMDEYSLNLNASKGKLVFECKKFFSKKTVEIDFAFPAFHGAGGEDGTIQGMWEFFGVPYAGCGLWTLSTTIHKGLTKKMFDKDGILNTKFLLFVDHQDRNEMQKMIEKTLQFPVFVKPTKAGSSIGISRVKTPEELLDALELAFFYDNEIIVEEGVKNVRDLTCAVLSNGTEILASPVQESPVGDGFFDYQKKYLDDGGAQLGKSESLTIPANISAEQTQYIQQKAKEIFVSLGGNGTLRVDFLMNDETKEIFANEINPLPGTLYHHLWEKMGVEMSQILAWMMEDGMQRAKNNKTHTAHFSSGVLNEANSMKLQFSHVSEEK